MRRQLPNLEPLTYGGFTLDLKYYLSHDYIDIGEAASDLPPIIEWVNGWLQDVTEQKLIQKQFVAQAEARAYFQLKNGLYETRGYGTTKPSEVALERAVQLDEHVIKAHDKYAIVYGWVQRLSNVLISLNSKLDLTRSTEATKRKLIVDAD